METVWEAAQLAALAAGALGGILTAFFTGALAWMTWRKERGRMHAEWRLEGYEPDPHLGIVVTVRNTRRDRITVHDARVARGRAVIRPTPERHGTGIPFRRIAYVGRAVEPGTAVSFRLDVLPDWQQLQLGASAWVSRASSWLARRAWQHAAIRLPHGHRVSIRLIIDTSVSRYWPSCRTLHIRIPAETIEKKAAKAA